MIATVLLGAGSAEAAPRHAICSDVGTTMGWGIASFSASGDWAATAHTTYGVDWRFLYIYVVPSNDPPDAQASFIRSKIAYARSVGAVPVLTFYDMLARGQQAGITGSSEADVVRQTLQNADVMRAYFDRVIFVLKTVADQGNVIVQVEPDTWGFMMWSFGVEGNADATSVPVKVAGSGHADLVGLADHAGGLGHAFLALRDKYAPDVRLGWHASNFRVGTRPEVVTGFFSSMGEWDVLVSEEPHNEASPSTWWDPWDAARLQTNLDWFTTITKTTKLPMLLWQLSIGTADFHLLGADGSDRTMLTRYAQAGIVGLLMDMRGSGDPDQFRATEDPLLGTVPPASTGAGGTAADMRTRLAAYAKNEMVWPAGSPCAGGAASPPGGPAPVDPAVTPSSGRDAPGSGGGEASGCGCRAATSAARGWPLALGAGLALLLRRRRRQPR